MNTAPSVPVVDEYFISRAGADKALAQLIAQIIREAEGKPFYQDETFGHADFMRRMEQGYERMARMVALLSPEYQKSEHCRAEYNHVLGKDPNNLKERLIVLKVADCEAEGSLQNLRYTDLTPVLTDDVLLRRVVRVALGFDTRPGEIDFSQIYRRAGQQIRHPEVRAPNDFTGREDMLKALGDKLWQGRSTVAIRNSIETTLALRGLGGVGKTVLAQAYAWQNRDRYHGVWWVRADKRETLIDDLVALGKRFIPGLDAQEPEDAALTTLDRIAQMPTGKPWLLVYDNVDDQTTIRRLTPPANVHVLITTRLTEWHGEADQLPVDVFDPETAIEYLLALANKKDQQRDAAGRLADALQRLPLALSHARSYCRERAWPFDEYAARLPELIRRKPRGAAYPDTVFATFSLAIEKAAEECADAERLMGLLAFFAPDQLPLWLIPDDVLGKVRLGDALAALNRVSLVTLEKLPDGAPSVSVHRLVQEVTRGRLSEAGTREKVAAEATRLVEAAYDNSGSFDAPQKNTYLLPHALSVLPHTPREDVAAAWHTLWVLLQTGDFRRSRGETSAALSTYREGRGIAERFALDPDNVRWQRDLSASQQKIGDVLIDQGDLEGALESYRAALAIRERLASNDPDNAGRQQDLSVLHSRIGDVCVDQGNLSAALERYRAGLTIAERLAKADPGNPDWQHTLSISHGKIGDVLLDQGNLSAALESYQAALAIAEPFAGTGPGIANWQRDLSVWQNKIGDVFRAQGNLPAALEGYRAALAIQERLASADPNNAVWERDLSVSHNKIGDVLRAQGNLPLALESYQAALAVRRRLSSGDPGNAVWQRDLSVSHNKIGDVLQAQGDLPAALESYRAGLAIAEHLAKTDPSNAGWQRDLSVAHNKIGDVHQARGHLPAALESYRTGLAIAEHLAGSDPSNAGWQRDLSVAHNGIGRVLFAQGDLPGALKSYGAMVAIAEQLVSVDPCNAGWQRDLSVSSGMVATVHEAQGNLAEALEGYRKVFATQERLAAADPGNAGWQRDLSVSQDKIGGVLVEQGDLPRGLESYQASLAIRKRLAAADPGNAGWQRDLALSQGRVATVLALQGDRDGALQGFRQGREIVAQLREQSPDNAALPKDLAWFDEQINSVQASRG